MWAEHLAPIVTTVLLLVLLLALEGLVLARGSISLLKAIDSSNFVGCRYLAYLLGPRNLLLLALVMQVVANRI